MASWRNARPRAQLISMLAPVASENRFQLMHVTHPRFSNHRAATTPNMHGNLHHTNTHPPLSAMSHTQYTASGQCAQMRGCRASGRSTRFKISMSHCGKYIFSFQSKTNTSSLGIGLLYDCWFCFSGCVRF